MKSDERDAAGADADLRAWFRVGRELDATRPLPSFDAIVARARSARPPLRARSAWALAAAVAMLLVGALIDTAPPSKPPATEVAPIADGARGARGLVAARMPTDALIAGAEMPLAGSAWSTLPTSALGPAPGGASLSVTR